MKELMDNLLKNYFKGNKIKILEQFKERNYKIIKLNKLAKKLDISMPLLCYHINGNRFSVGLKEAGCIVLKRVNGYQVLSITDNGELIVYKYGDYVDNR